MKISHLYNWLYISTNIIIKNDILHGRQEGRLNILLKFLLTFCIQWKMAFSCCDEIYSSSCVIWIFTSSKDLLQNLLSQSSEFVSSIKTFELSTIHTTIQDAQLTNHLHRLIKQSKLNIIVNYIIIHLRSYQQKWERKIKKILVMKNLIL